MATHLLAETGQFAGGSIGTGCHLLSRQHGRPIVRAPRAGLKSFRQARGAQDRLFKETASGARNDRIERNEVMALARNHEIDAILVTELSRWGRSTQELPTPAKKNVG